MRIDPNVVVSPTALSVKQPEHGAKPAAPENQAASVVALSSAGVAVSTEPTSPTVTGRIERIRELLDKGEYPVDLDLLASRIVDDEVMRSGTKS